MSSTYVPQPSLDYKGWYEIPGYSGCCANTQGMILTKRTGHRTRGGNAGRYLKISAYQDGKDRPSLYYVHILVCLAFHGLPPIPGMVVMHRNNNRWDNRPSNLKWGTQSQNILDVYRDGLRKPRVTLETQTSTLGPNSPQKPLYWITLDDSGIQITMSSDEWVSVFDSITGALRFHYSDFSSYFTEQQQAYVDFWIYRPIIETDSVIHTPESLTANQIQWNAYVTGLYGLKTGSKATRVGKLRVYPPNERQRLYIHPYNDRECPKQLLGPSTFQWEWLTQPVSSRSNDTSPVYFNWSSE